MVTEEAFPYAATAEPHYAKEDTDSMQAGRGGGGGVPRSSASLASPLIFIC